LKTLFYFRYIKIKNDSRKKLGNKMSKSLVIVESPAKSKTINKYLGSNYIVKASIGHIRDLPSGQVKSTPTKSRAKNQSEKDLKLFNRMGINPEAGWNPQYEIMPGKEKTVAELVKLAKDADYVYLATDLDREGEAIAWHLQEVIGLPKEKFKRVVFNEITKTAIQEAFNNPSTLNMDMVNAQQTRRFLDRVVGFMVSPVLWEKVGRGLSAGRVQSVAVRLIVEKEKEIKAFVPEEYWNIAANLSYNQQNFNCLLFKYKNQEFKSLNKEQTDKHLDALKNEKYVVVSSEQKDKEVKSPRPFTTSTMQQAASTVLRFSVKKTMMLAQSLYERGFITYMRTDSLNLSADALNSIRDHIKNNYGDSYLPAKAKYYASKANAQNAHEAIRPTDVNCPDSKLAELDKDSKALYKLILNRVIACQMNDAIVTHKEIIINAGDYSFKLSGKLLKFNGWMRLDAVQKDYDLPAMNVGDELSLIELQPSQHFTRAPSRYTEASLVAELEKRGIGRPSTYAAIISTIQERGYVKIDQRRFFAEKIGEIVTSRLNQSFSELMDYDFTKDMESKLDAIAEEHLNWIECLDDFYAHLKKQLDIARQKAEEGGMENNKLVETTIKCPDCSSPMVIRNATTGVFLSCSSYNGKGRTAKDSCKKTLNLISEKKLPIFTNGDEDDESESKYLRSKHRCKLCGATMDSYILNENTKVHICANNPDCEGYEIEEGEFKFKSTEGPTIICDKCGEKMVLKSGRFGNYMDCTNENCKNTRKILKSGEVAPPKEEPVEFKDLICSDGKSYFVLRDGASGVFLASNAFPKVRETRQPTVKELKAHADLLPEKFKYLTLAPEQDEDGNLTYVKFSRKSKQQYVLAEDANRKSTGFIAYYKDGAWVVDDEKSKTKKTTKKSTKSK
jgi:DNA topoisomerase-1